MYKVSFSDCHVRMYASVAMYLCTCILNFKFNCTLNTLFMHTSAIHIQHNISTSDRVSEQYNK